MQFFHVVENFDDSPRSFVRKTFFVFFFLALVSLRVANVFYVDTATIRTVGRRVEMLRTTRTVGRGAESVVGCKPFFRVDGCCCISVHVPTSFRCCEIQPVVLGDEKMSERVFMMLPRECFVFVLQDS